MGGRRTPLRTAGLVAGAAVLLLAAGELARGYLKQVGNERFRQVHGFYTPPFRRGDPAPDFTLPDAAGRRHSLSRVVRQDTLLCFICGCDRCRRMQIYLGQMLRSLGSRAPKVVSVSKAPPESDAAWRRDTRLDQLVLYDSRKDNTPVIELYRGDPCPRLFRLDADRRVTWIGPSPAQVSLDTLGEAMAKNLGYHLPPPKR